MNNMSFGNGSATSPVTPNTRHGLNLNVPQADQQSTAANLSIKGDAGADWGAALHQWVDEHKYYPDAAAEQGQYGNVLVEFTAHRDGEVTGLHLLRGSGSPFLDQAFSSLFRDAHLPPFPSDAKDDQVTVDYTMEYILEGP